MSFVSSHDNKMANPKFMTSSLINSHRIMKKICYNKLYLSHTNITILHLTINKQLRTGGGGGGYVGGGSTVNVDIKRIPLNQEHLLVLTCGSR